MGKNTVFNVPMGSTNHPRIHHFGFPDQLGGHGTTDGSHGIGFEGTNLCRLVVGCETWHVVSHQGGVRRCKVWLGWFTRKGEEKKHIAKLTGNKKHDTICVYLLKRTYSSGGKRLQMLWPFDFRWDWKASKGLPWSKKYPTQPAKWTRMRRNCWLKMSFFSPENVTNQRLKMSPFFTLRSQTFSVVGIPH